MGVVVRQAWSKSQWTVLMGYFTISTKLLNAIKHITDDIFLSGRQRTGALCVCDRVRSRKVGNWLGGMDATQYDTFTRLLRFFYIISLLI